MAVLDVPRWALAFHHRHLVLVTALSLVPAGERVISQLWADHLPGSARVGSEVVTEAARLALLIAVWRLATRDDPPRAAGPRWRALLTQAGLMLVALVVFRFIPEAVRAYAVPEHAQHTYEAVLLGVKNLTVIPFTIIWLVGAVRQAFAVPAAPSTVDAQLASIRRST
jgi:hypothetical protein